MGLNNNILQQIKNNIIFKLAVLGILAVGLSILLDYFIPGRFGIIPIIIVGYCIIYVASYGTIQMIADNNKGFLSIFCYKYKIIATIILSIIVSFLLIFPVFIKN